MASAKEAEEFIQSLNGNSKLLGKHVNKSAKRLLFELLRYTDAKTFTKAKEEKDTPFVAFKIFPDRIVIDCNSDDLTKEELQAICQPIKEKAKGANFRTIVAATKRTHIQSGNFSFEFQHNIADHDNSDIMRPVWVTPAQTVPADVTRITLYLHDQGSKDEIQNLRNIICAQFMYFQQESILFLKNIRSIKVETRQMINLPRSKHFEKKTIDEYRVSVEVTTVKSKDSEEDIHTQLFHVTESSQPSDGLTKDLTLAFPLTKDFKVSSDFEEMQVFNIVKLDNCCVEFHIHTDFDIDDDLDKKMHKITEDPEFSHEVSTLLIKAILQFCEHPTLQYYWPMFIYGLHIWPKLHVMIMAWISQNPVFSSRNMKNWRLLHHLISPDLDAQDESGNPLLDDPINDSFLSTKYPPDIKSVLREYGLAYPSDAQYLDLLELNFNDPVLQLRTTRRTRTWYRTFEKIIFRLLENDEYSDKVKSLPMLQIEDGTMVSAASEPVYFHKTKGIDIPPKVPGRFIKTSADHKTYSMTLYRRLGVSEAPISRVRDAIFDKLSTSSSLPLDDINRYLGYLYITHKPSNPEDQYRDVRVLTLTKEWKNPWESIVYIPGMEHPYTPQSLLGTGKIVLSDPVNFLHPEILQYSPEHFQALPLSWKTWLCDCLGVRERLSLTRQKAPLEQEPENPVPTITMRPRILSEQCTYVFRNRPDKFLGLLQYLWGLEAPEITEDKALRFEIGGLSTKSFSQAGCNHLLRFTSVPRQELKEVVARYMEYPDTFPFLNLGEEIYEDQDIVAKWSFLKNFGVKLDNDLDFLVEIIKAIKLSGYKPSSQQMQKIFELYSAINTRFLTCGDDEKQRAIEYFNTYTGILTTNNTEETWTCPSDCCWNTPTHLFSRHSLQRFYQKRVLDRKVMQDITHLFRVGLGIRDANEEDVVRELRSLRDKNCKDIGLYTDFFNYLHKEVNTSSQMRTAFGDEKIIFVQSENDSAWLSVQECFWSKSENTLPQYSLKKCYPGLGYFFDRLGVRLSAYDKLVYYTRKDVEQVKETLLSFMDEAKFFHGFDKEPMNTAKMFPVQHPTVKGQLPHPVELCSLATDFCIGDRDYLKTSLQSSIKMLNFDAREVRQLHPLFRWLSMEDRYLSLCAKETLNTVPSCILEEWDLGDKAYHIACVAQTFSCYGSCSDALSLYQKLQTTKIAKVDCISIDLKVVQDDQTFQSSDSQDTLVYISIDGDDNPTIYVSYDDNNKHLCSFSVLPRKLQQWLMQDESRMYMDISFEVTNALTSIFASDAAILDDILEDQGISQVSFENQDIDESKVKRESHEPQVKQEID